MTGSITSCFRALPGYGKAAIVVFGLFLVYTLLGFFLVGPVARNILVKELSNAANRPTSIESVDFNPLFLSVTLRGFSMLEQDGKTPFASVDEVYLNVSASSLFILGPYVQELALTNPFLHIRLLSPGRYNFSDIIAGKQDNAAESVPDAPVEKESELFPWLLKNFSLADGRIVFDDDVLKLRHELSDLNARVPFTSTVVKYRTDYTHPYLSGRLNNTRFLLDGRTMPFEPSMHTEFTIEFDGVDLRNYWKYVPYAETMQLDNGVFHSDLKLVFERGGDPLPTLSLQGNASITDFSLSPKDGAPFLSFARLDLDLRRVRPLHRIFQFNAIRLDSPYVELNRDANGTIDLVQRFAPNTPRSPEPEAVALATKTQKNDNATDLGTASEVSAPPNAPISQELILDVVGLHNGTVQFADDSGSGPFRKTLRNVNVDVRNFTLAPDQQAHFKVGATLVAQQDAENDEQLRAEGDMTASPFAMNATLDAQDLDIPSYAPFYDAFLPVHVAAGRLGLDTALHMNTVNATQIRVNNGAAVLNGLTLADPTADNARIFSLEQLNATGIGFDLAGRSLNVASVILRKGIGRLVREKDGGMYPVRLFTQTDANNARPSDATDSAGAEEAEDADDGTPPSSPFRARIASVQLQDWDASFVDKAAPGKAEIRLSPLNLTLANVSSDTAQTMQVDADMSVNAKGRLRLGADLRPAPLSLNGNLVLEGLPLSIADGYIPPDLGLRMADGDMDVRGDYALEQKSKTSGLTLQFKGGLDVDDLTAGRTEGEAPLARLHRLDLADLRLSLALPAESDKQKPPHLEYESGLGLAGAELLTVQGQELFSLKACNATRVAFAQQPRTLVVDGLRIQGPAVDLRRNSDGSMNTNQLFPDNEKTQDKPASVPLDTAAVNATAPSQTDTKQERSFDALEISNATLESGSVRFADRTVKPNYRLTMDDLAGRLDHFSLEPGARSTFSLNAVVDGQAPFNLQGSTNPLEHAVHTTMWFTIDNFNLPSLSAYTTEFLAYPIATGKLHGRTDLSIQETSLNSQNTFLLDRFSLGKRVDNPDAAQVPIQLALALLQDSNGDIELDLPIQGRLDDPNFRIAPMVMRAIIGLMTNIVTSPFNLLGGIVGLAGSGEDISVVEFTPGSSALAPQDMQKLGDLGKAMKKRPRLEMVVEGYVAPDEDAKALGEQRLEAWLDKLRGGKGKGDFAPIVGKERLRLLRSAFDRADLEAPQGVDKLTARQLQDMLVQHMQADNEALSELAEKRAMAVRDYFLDQGGVDAKRIFLKYTRADVPPRKEDGVHSRVEMSVK